MLNGLRLLPTVYLLMSCVPQEKGEPKSQTAELEEFVDFARTFARWAPLQGCVNSAETRANPSGFNEFWRNDLREKWERIKVGPLPRNVVMQLLEQESWEKVWENYEPKKLNTAPSSQASDEDTPQAGVYLLNNGKIGKWYSGFEDHFVEGFLAGACLGGPEVDGISSFENAEGDTQVVVVMEQVHADLGSTNWRDLAREEREPIVTSEGFLNWLEDILRVAELNRISPHDFQFMTLPFEELSEQPSKKSFQIMDTDYYVQVPEGSRGAQPGMIFHSVFRGFLKAKPEGVITPGLKQMVQTFLSRVKKKDQLLYEAHCAVLESRGWSFCETDRETRK